MFDVASYGAAGDGVVDDQPSILAAIQAAQAAGGGVVYFPKGTYLLGSSETVDLAPGNNPPVTTQVCLPITSDNVYLRGEGQGVSKLLLGNGVNAVMVGFGGCKGVGIEKLELDGNRSYQSSAHACLYDFLDVENFLIEDMYIHHSSGYGIGLQHAPIINCTISKVLIEDTGSDGIDIKNSDLGNRTNRMSNVTVRRAGLNTSLTGQAGIDIRGRWTLDNINVEDFKNDGVNGVCLVGIRFRPDGQYGASGGNYCSLTNFYVEPSLTSSTIGVQVCGYRNTIGNGAVKGAGTGFELNNVENVISNTEAVSCGNGYVLRNDTGTTSDKCIITGSISRSNQDSGFKIYSNYTQLNGVTAWGNPIGINIKNASQHTVLSGISQGNTTNLLNSGGSTHNNLALP